MWVRINIKISWIVDTAVDYYHRIDNFAALNAIGDFRMIFQIFTDNVIFICRLVFGFNRSVDADCSACRAQSRYMLTVAYIFAVFRQMAKANSTFQAFGAILQWRQSESVA